MALNSSTLASNIGAFGEENQKTLANTRVSIFGQNEISDYVTVLLAGLGVGEILVQGNRSETGLKPYLNTIDVNPQTRITRRNSKAIWYKHTQFAADSTFNIEQHTATYTTIKQRLGEESRPHPISFEPLEHSQKPFLKTLNAALAVDQFRKQQFTLCKADRPGKITNPKQKNPFPNQLVSEGSKKNTLIIGAGGIGTYVGLELAKVHTPKITIIDDDVIEPKNLNRQLLYIGEVGNAKATTLTEKLTLLAPSTYIKGIVSRIEREGQLADYIRSNQIDQVYCATDNFESRLLISKVCADMRIPLVEGGCNTTNAIVSQYEPDQTRPVHETRRFADFTKQKKEQVDSESCVETVNPSVVIPNAIAGALMYGTSLQRCTRQGDKLFLEKTLNYDSFSKHPFTEAQK